MRAWIEAATLETRFAVRGLLRSRGLTAAIVATLGLGIGVNAGLFDLVYRLFLRAPAFVDRPDSVHRIYVTQTNRSGDRFTYAELGYPTFRDVEERMASSDAVVAHFRSELVVGRDESAALLPVLLASGGFWSLFDVTPALGRFFTPDEDRLPGGTAVVVLDHGFWSRAMGGDVGRLGTRIRIGSRMYTIIGVAPPGFRGLDQEPVAAYVPMTAAGADIAGPEFATRPFTTWLTLVVRRRPGVPAEDARVDAERALRESLETSRDTAFLEQSGPRVVLGQVLQDRGPLRRESASLSVWLLGMGVLVLAIACINIANLLLTRALDSIREQAVRAALGAPRSRLWMRSVIDALLLAVFGGAAAVPLGFISSVVVTRLLVPESAQAASSSAVLPGTLVLVPFVAILTAALPVIRAGRIDIAVLIATRSRTNTGGHRLRSALVVGQAALSAMLLVGAGLFLRSLVETIQLDPGYDANRILLINPDTRGANIPPDQLAGLDETLLDRATRTPGVAAAALAGTVPFWRNSFDGVRLEDGTVPPGSYATNWVSADYFETTGTRLLRGRTLNGGDIDGSALVVVISEAMERTVWGAGRGLGECFRIGGATAPCREVVGVVENIRRGDIRDEAGSQYYVPYRQYRSPASTLLVRAAGSDATSLMESLRRELDAAAPAGVFLRIQAMRDRLNQQTRSWTVGAAILCGFGVLAVGLGVLGLFSLLAWDVSVRARELGIRVALGSTAAGILRLVLRRGFRLTAVGLATGLLIAFAAAPAVEGYLFQVRGRDPSTFLGVVLVLFVAAGVAGLVPAWRAARVDPVVLLAAE